MQARQVGWKLRWCGMQAGCKMLRDAEGQAAQLLSHWRLQSRNLAAAQAVSREATARADSLQAVSDSRNLPGLIDQVCSLLQQCTMPSCDMRSRPCQPCACILLSDLLSDSQKSALQGPAARCPKADSDSGNLPDL